MDLSSDLIKEFAKITNKEEPKRSETTVNGTVVQYGDKLHVRIDGSDQLTPVTTTTGIRAGDRVTVLIKDHTAIVTGNTSSPSTSTDDLEDAKTEIGDKITEVEILIADKVDTIEFNAEKARIDSLVADNVVIKEKLTATEADIGQLEADNVTINQKLTAAEAEIEDLTVTKLDAEIADLKFATIENLEATNADIHNLTADYGDFKDLATDKFTATDAAIEKLDTEKLSATEADLKYANIDFANIGSAAIENFFSKSGMIGDLVVGEGTITGTLVGVTIKGDLIEGGTVVADKLVVKGEDGLYYKLNTDGVTTESEQTEYNSINGSIITAKSITATKIAVDDLVAFGATIGGFKIDEDSIYSGVKSSIDNTTRGIFMGDDGQMALGDGNNYLKYFKDTDGTWKLAISADNIRLGSSGKDLNEEINDKINDAVDSIEFGARNLILDSKSISVTRIDTFNNWLVEKVPFMSNSDYGIELVKKGGNLVLSFDYDISGITTATDLQILLESADGTWAEVTIPSIPLNVGDNVGHYSAMVVPTSNQQKWGRGWLISGFGANQNPNVIVTLSNVKFERGNKTTDWTPAPEDVEQSIDNAKEDLEVYTQTLIEQTRESIEMTVSEEYYTKSDAEELVGSIDTRFEQTKDEFLFEFNQFEESLDQSIADTEAKFNDISKYIRFVDGDIILGERDNPLTLRIEHDRIAFLDNNSEVAYFSNNQLYVTDVKVLNRLDIGKFSWLPRDNGNTTLRFIG